MVGLHIFTPKSFSLLLLAALAVGCATPDRYMLVLVRDKLTRAPVPEPYFTIASRNDAAPTKVEKANNYGTARVQLPTGPNSKYNITVDAQGYDLHTFELPTLNNFFPSGTWRQAQPTRQYPLRPENTLELMLTIEP